MPVDITQYRGSVGIFNNRNFVFRPKFSNFIGHKCWNSNHLYFNISMIFPMNLVLFLVFVIVFSPRCSFHKTPINTGTPMLVITVALIFNYLCFKCNILLLCGDVDLNPRGVVGESEGWGGWACNHCVIMKNKSKSKRRQ